MAPRSDHSIPSDPARLRVPPAGPLLLVSPHYDDAALSCAALIDRSEPLDVLTVFGGEPDPPVQGEWDRKTGFTDSAASMAARREEDRRAFARTSHRMSSLDLLEGQHARMPRSAGEAQALQRALLHWVERSGGGTVALPAGAGRIRGRMRFWIERALSEFGGPLPHPDHLFARDAALESLRSRLDVDLLLYEELPYALAGGADRDVAMVTRRFARRATACVVEVDRRSKAERIAAYSSQVPQLLAREARLDQAEALPAVERYWYLSASGSGGR